MVIVWANVGGILRDKKVNLWAKLGGNNERQDG